MFTQFTVGGDDVAQQGKYARPLQPFRVFASTSGWLATLC